MIIVSIINLLLTMTFAVFGLLPVIPSLEGLTGSIDIVFDFIVEGISLMGIFIRPFTVVTILPLLAAVIAFFEIYDITLWILKKIPVLGIQ